MNIAKITKNKKNCTKGWSCGSSCISKTNKCRIVVKEKSKSFLDQLAGFNDKKSGGSDKINDLLKKKSWSTEEAAEFDELFKQLSAVKKVKTVVKAEKSGAEPAKKAVKKKKKKPSWTDQLLDGNFDAEELKPTKKLSKKEKFARGFSPERPKKGAGDNYKPSSSIRPGVDKKFSDKESLDKINQFIAKDEYSEMKTNTAMSMNSKLSKQEAYAIGRWVSHEYPGINKQRITGSPDTDRDQISNQYLSDAIKKSKKYSKKAMQEDPLVQERIEERGGFIEGEYSLSRKMSFKAGQSAVGKDFITRKVKDAAENDGITSSDTFDAFTFANNNYFDGNVEMRMRPKEGESGGALVDEYKENAFEAEVLFDVGTKAKLDKIRFGNTPDEQAEEALEQLKAGDSTAFDKLYKKGNITMFFTEL